MSLSPKDGFLLLKQKIREYVKESLSIRKELKDWSIQDIQDFQADLEAKCKSSVSEKWIYLHFKNQNDKLPRVDVLNLLAKYCDYKNWEHFLFEHQKAKGRKPRLKWALILVLLLIIVISIGMVSLNRKSYQILVFKDAYTQRILKTSELHFEFKGKTDGDLKRIESAIKWTGENGDSLLVNGPYYKMARVQLGEGPDTLLVKLLPDDYALMLNFFSRSDTRNIEKRERQLKEAIHEEAKIFQVYDEFEGLELLNKTEFIERLILPVNFLKNLEILDIQYREQKIYRLRFRQNKESHE